MILFKKKREREREKNKQQKKLNHRLQSIMTDRQHSTRLFIKQKERVSRYSLLSSVYITHLMRAQYSIITNAIRRKGGVTEIAIENKPAGWFGNSRRQHSISISTWLINYVRKIGTKSDRLCCKQIEETKCVA